MAWGTWDIEAERWVRVTNVCAISDAGDVEHFEDESGGGAAIEAAAEHFDKVGGNQVAHAAGIYDTLLLSQAREKPWQDLIMSGSAVLCAHDRKLRVRDSFRAWLAGLKKVGKFLDAEDHARRVKWEAWKARRGRVIGPELVPEAPHGEPGAFLKKDVDRSRMDELSPREKKIYCESDTAILREGVIAHMSYLDARKARMAWTAGSAAIALLRTLEAPSWGVLEKHRLDLETAVRASSCVRGARVETWALGRVDGVYCYDRKSAYPASYMDDTIGVGAVHLDADDEDRPGAVWLCQWFWPWRGGDARARVPPVLDQVTGAGAGWCRAWCIREEIEALEQFVGVRRLEGWAPLAMAPIGQLFCRDLYAEKERGSFFAKVFLNSLHGKFSESPVKECWTSGGKPTAWYGPPPEIIGDYWHYLDVAVDKNNLCAPNVQPLAGAHILGRARIALWRLISMILAAGYGVYYCDTDSIHTNCPPDVMATIIGREYGTQLGQLALEGGPYTCFYVGPKSYCAVDPTTGKVEKGACKGIPWNDLKDGVRQPHSIFGNLYRQARGKEKGEDLRLAVFEEALREIDGAKVKKEGVATWKQGLRLKAGWTLYETTRTLLPHERGKLFDRAAGPTTYAYQSPAELLTGRGLDLAHDPFADETKNAAEEPNDVDIIDSVWGSN